ncbi:hypothetical protein A4G20_05210 [Pasteurellaceae bacterium RH1A]|nr:hypothetical protein A4G20_05210 [Pasteurellaceae bacterium RH1A]
MSTQNLSANSITRNPEADWDWWLSLSPQTKFSLMITCQDSNDENYGALIKEYGTDVKGICPVYHNNDLYNDKNGYIRKFLNDAILKIERFSPLQCRFDYMRMGMILGEKSSFSLDDIDIESLAYLPNLSYLGLGSFDLKSNLPTGLAKLKNLSELSLDSFQCREEDIEENIKILSSIFAELPNLKILWMGYSVFRSYFQENEVALEKFKALNPNCEVKC